MSFFDDYKSSLEGVTASFAIKRRADEIIEIANSGEPPILAVIPTFEGQIDERSHWHMIDMMIAEFLGPTYLRTGRKRVPTRLPHKGAFYARVVVET